MNQAELEANNRQLNAELATVKRERSEQAAMCVRLEDRVNELLEERKFFLTALLHVWGVHTTDQRAICNQKTLHDKLKEYGIHT